MLLGLTGPAGVGKDTVGKFLSGYGYTPYAMAAPLKEMLAVVGLIEPRTREEKEALIPGYPFSYRTASQKLGTEWARAVDPDFWLKQAELRVGSAHQVVVTDVRFENEASWVRSRGGRIIHIIGRETTVSGENATHASENGILKHDSDWVLPNGGTLEVLHGRVLQLLKWL